MSDTVVHEERKETLTQQRIAALQAWQKSIIAMSASKEQRAGIKYVIRKLKRGD